jgi:DNA polymerase (family 10)
MEQRTVNMTKKQLIVLKLKEMADKIEAMEPNNVAASYKRAAYSKAARSIQAFEGVVRSAQELKDIRGVGPKILEKIEEILKSGTLKALDQFSQSDHDFSSLMYIEGVGPVKALKMYNAYKVRNAEEVMALIKSGKMEADKKLELAVRRSLIKNKRLPRKQVLEICEPIEFHMRLNASSAIIARAGSLRRKTKSSKDVDLLICGTPEVLKAAKETFLSCNWDLVTANGNVRIDAIYKGIGFNGWFLPTECYGSGLLHCTGSGGFNEKLRAIAKFQGMKLSEYGLRDRKTGKAIESYSEEKIFNCLGFEFIPPEKREENIDLQLFRVQ